MGIKLGKEQILQCFDALNQKLAAHDQHGEILVCGGASMALLFDNTTVTKDIDAVILSTEMKNEISRYAAEIGAEQGLDDGWFNEAAKGYINLTWERKEISRYSNLAVYSVPAEQLLAMKLSAARIDARDMEDSIKLMKHLGLQKVDEALEILERNMPGRTLTAKNEYFTRETFAEYQEKEKTMEQKRLFVDMDGTLAVFTPVDTLETLYERGYYAKLQPHENVIQGVKRFLQENEDTEVYIMSSVLADSPYALDEKNDWLDIYLPEIGPDHRIFPPCGQSKADYVPEGVKETDYLLDDYSDNLHEWEAAGGCGIKLMNGINGSKGSWMGSRIEYDLPAARFWETLSITMENDAWELTEKEATAVKLDFAGMPAQLMAAYEELMKLPEEKRSITYSAEDEPELKDGVTRERAAKGYEKALQAIGLKLGEIECVYVEEYYGGNEVKMMEDDMKKHLMPSGRPIIYLTPGTDKEQFIATMDEESQHSIEMAVRLAELQEGYSGAELEEKVTEAMSDRLVAIDEDFDIRVRREPVVPGSTFENGGSSYMVLAEKERGQGYQKDLLLMRGDGYFVIASGFDEETQSWDSGRYFGRGEEALANASLAFSDGYISTYFANLPLKEQFKAVLEAELPEVSGDEELQDTLYEQFMLSSQDGFFSNDFRHEIQESLSAKDEKEIDHGWEME